MHPYHPVFFHRAPSRVFWLLIGAGVATWWHHSSAMRDHRAQYFPCMMQHRRVHDSPSETTSHDAALWRSTPAPDRNAPDWERDGERLRNLQKRAGETVADLTESTLDSIVVGAESLKVKLAQLRAERERVEAEKKISHPAA